jgi:hypothetical protein
MSVLSAADMAECAEKGKRAARLAEDTYLEKIAAGKSEKEAMAWAEERSIAFCYGHGIRSKAELGWPE